MAEQILSEISGTETALSWSLDGTGFLSYGVYVSASSGIVDGLKMKEPQIKDWQGDHGVFVDLSAPRYEQREIELDCFIHATGKLDFLSKITAFEKAIQKAGLRKLTLTISNKPLIYMVYKSESLEVKKQWSETDMFGTFSLKLIEPQPIKRLLVFTATAGATVSLTMTTSNPINIYWGDGLQLLDAYGTSITKTHTYSNAGTYYILLAGVIEEISSFTTTANVVWSKY